MSAQKACKILDGKCQVSDTWKGGEQIDCDEFGAILWVERGVVESVSVSA